MKRTLALTLAAILLAAALASCAAPSATAGVSANVRLTSSEATDAGVWLTERLGDKLTDAVVMGTSADGYGIDLSSLEADGYVIRSLDGEIALLARTADGLDRAARRYAKSVEAGEALTDVTYHEGYRVKRIEIAGRDISEYTVFCEKNEYLQAAAQEFVSRIRQACGAEIPVSTDAPSAPYISIGFIRDEALSTVGYRWSVDGGGLTIGISDAYVYQNASVAVARFLQKKLDWVGLLGGKTDLASADLVEIPAGDGGTETLDFDCALPFSSQMVKFDTMTYPFIGKRKMVSHGMQGMRIAGELSTSPAHNWAEDQPCYLDEDFYELSLKDVRAYIEQTLASGKKIGDDFLVVDLAHGDNWNFCMCRNCSKLYMSEGATHSAAILTWINRLSDELAQDYPGLYFGMFAYQGTKKPPKTVYPNGNITVTFCFDRSCSAHPLDGSRCTTGVVFPGVSGSEVHSNPALSSYLETWVDRTPGGVSVWYYGISNILLSSYFLHTVRDDVKYLHDLGVDGVFWEAHSQGYDPNWVAFMLCSELVWDVDMSGEEYDRYYDRYLRLFYGDAAPYVRELTALMCRIEEHGACASCWGFGPLTHAEGVGYDVPNNSINLDLNVDLLAENCDLLCELAEGAIPLADTALQQRWLDNISCGVIFRCTVAGCLKAIGEGDNERVEELCRRYLLIDERLSYYGVDMTDMYQLASGPWEHSYVKTLPECFSERYK